MSVATGILMYGFALLHEGPGNMPTVRPPAMEGRLVVPVGDRYTQALMKIVRVKEGITKTDLGGCRFVNLLGTHGWQE